MQFLLPGVHHYSWWGRDTLAVLTGGLKCLGALTGLQGQFDIMLLVTGVMSLVLGSDGTSAEWGRVRDIGNGGKPLDLALVMVGPPLGALSWAHVFRSAAVSSAGALGGKQVTSRAWRIVSWTRRLPIVLAIAKEARFECVSLPSESQFLDCWDWSRSLWQL